MRRALVALGLVAVLAVPAAFAAPAQITVYAASSLTNVFPAIAPNETYSFAGSSTLAAQIEQGAPADVLASANMALPRKLHQEGYCAQPVVFTRNAVVVVVPTANPAHIHTVYDLAKKGVTVDIAQPGVPIGTYTRHVLHNMKLASAVLKNVVGEETDVRTILSKVSLNEVDAGFVYSTDAKTVPDKVKTIRVPVWAQPKIKYGICVVTASGNKSAAQAFIKRVLSPFGQKKLHAYGFLPR